MNKVEVHEKETYYNTFCPMPAYWYFFYISLPDYRIFNSISYSNQDTRDTTLKVVVYKYWEINDTIKKIEEEHNKINGTPTTLEINLYYSKLLIRYGKKPFKTVMFEYNQKKRKTTLY